MLEEEEDILCIWLEGFGVLDLEIQCLMSNAIHHQKSYEYYLRAGVANPGTGNVNPSYGVSIYIGFRESCS